MQTPQAQETTMIGSTIRKRAPLVWCASIIAALTVFAPLALAAPNEIEKQPDGIILHLPGGLLRLQVLSDSVIRVAYAKQASFFSHVSIDVVPHPLTTAAWKTTTTPQSVTIKTDKITVRVDRVTGAVT
jgi:hypothetical protein